MSPARIDVSSAATASAIRQTTTWRLCPTAASNPADAAAVIAPDLRARLAAAGVPVDLAARTAALLEALVAARYGSGAPSGDTEASARAIVEELEALFREGDERREG